MDVRWIAFREGAAASFGAALPSSLPVGLGWRGGHVRDVDSIEDLDTLVQGVAERAGAAVGMWQADGFAYGVAAAAGESPIPFLLGVDVGGPPDAAAAAIARCGFGSSATGWRQRTALALSTWSAHAPRAVDPLEMDAILQIADAEADADVVETWCRLLGMAVPVDRQPDPTDLAAQARAELTRAAERRRQRRSADVSW
ncbi:MAG: hypothetical protein ABJB55_00750 [Actinomycetota bacterium]